MLLFLLKVFLQIVHFIGDFSILIKSTDYRTTILVQVQNANFKDICYDCQWRTTYIIMNALDILRYIGNAPFQRSFRICGKLGT